MNTELHHPHGVQDFTLHTELVHPQIVAQKGEKSPWLQHASTAENVHKRACTILYR